MKRILFALATMALLFACKAENKNKENGQDNQDEITVTGEALEVTDYTATLTGYANLPLELGNAKVGIVYDKNQSFENGKMVEATMLDGSNKFTVTLTDLEPSTTYYYKSFVQNGFAIQYGEVFSFTTEEAKFPAGAVDLGIVITRADGTSYNLYWAESNLGENGLCAKPEDRGDYYAWGEIEAKKNYSWSTYKFGTSESGPFSKYNTTDNKTVIEPEDDVAHVKLGGKWRIPTSEEWDALKSQCDFDITDDYNGTGAKGFIFIGPNGNSILIPYSGSQDGEEIDDSGEGAAYWSSSSLSSYPAYAVSYGFMNSGSNYRTSIDRYYGFCIRPVTEY